MLEEQANKYSRTNNNGGGLTDEPEIMGRGKSLGATIEPYRNSQMENPVIHEVMSDEYGNCFKQSQRGKAMTAEDLTNNSRFQRGGRTVKPLDLSKNQGLIEAAGFADARRKSSDSQER